MEAGLPVSIAEDPPASVVLGTGKMLENFKLPRKVSVNQRLCEVLCTRPG
jgi:rod shape-determining protein MreB